MRDLHQTELKLVSGGVGDPVPHDNRDGAKWGNNGFGNGADFNNTAPGKSDMHGPTGPAMAAASTTASATITVRADRLH
jgi:hypothetical protein